MTNQRRDLTSPRPAFGAVLLTARSNMDNAGVSLGSAMPKCLVTSGAGGQLLTTGNFADTYAFLKTQRGESATQSP
jgi:hypothetical protein